MADSPLNQSPAVRAAPAMAAYNLTAAMVSDTVDLATMPKALRIWNGSAAAITVMATPTSSGSNLAADAVPITVPAGAASYEPISVRRIWSTGSTGLIAALGAGTVEVLLLTL